MDDDPKTLSMFNSLYAGANINTDWVRLLELIFSLEGWNIINLVLSGW